MIDDLSNTDLKLVLTAVQNGATVDEAIATLIPEKKRDIVILFHSLFCKGTHTQEGDCNFYNEVTWIEPDHIKWLNILDFAMLTSNADIDLVKSMLPNIIEVIQSRQDVLEKDGEKGLALLNHLLTL